MRARVARGGVAVALVTAAVLATLAAMAVAARIPASHRPALDAFLDAVVLLRQGVPFAPVSPAVLDRSLDPSTLTRLLDGHGGGEPAHAPSPRSKPKPPPEATDPTLEEGLTAQPDLRITMSADRSGAAPGDVITYTITFTNTGKAAARQVRVTSHVPEHTTFVAECEDGAVSVGPNPGSPAGYTVGVCVLPVAETPGEHAFTTDFDNVPPGRTQVFSFKVKIDADAPAGSEIRNHAHVTALRVPRRTSNEVVTRVTSVG